jgi:hypothetical protein
MAVSTVYDGVKSTQKETHMLTSNSSLLRNALFIDSVVSFISGLAFLLFSKAIASFLGLPASWIVIVLGIVAVVYSIEIYLAARAEPVNTRIAKVAIYGNLIWVLASVVLIFANLVPFAIAGKWAIAIAADIVLVFAIFQYIGLRKVAN